MCKGTGIDKIVIENEIGLVIDYDAEQFYKAIRYLCENPDVALAMGEKGRKLYEKEYSWELMKKKLVALYSSLE